jgi:hypothetical protein
VKTYLSMIKHPFCYAALLLGCLPRLVAAEEPQVVSSTPTTAAPIYKVGDTWTMLFNKTDTQPGVTGVQTVVVVTDNQTTLSVSINGKTPITEDFNDQRDLVRKDDVTWEPSFGGLSFPMMVGKSWDSHHLKRYSSGSYDVNEHAEVVAFERVQVPAGSFDAYKIVLRSLGAPHVGGAAVVPFTATYWYAPSVKRIIKSDMKTTIYHRVQTENYELITFSLTP